MNAVHANPGAFSRVFLRNCRQLFLWRWFWVSWLTVFSVAHAEILVDTRYQYDRMGHPLAITNGAGQVERQTWDALGRLQTQTNPLNQTTLYGYSPNDAPSRVQTPNGAVTTWANDGLGQPRNEISPDRGTTGYVYDAAGNLIRQLDARGVRIDTTYDLLNRPLERRFYLPNQTLAATHRYTWDRAPRGIGRLDRLDAGLNSLSFDYDLAGHIVTRSYIRGAVTRTVRSAYNAATGRLATLTYPSGAVLQYQYDAAGRLVGLAWGGVAIATGLQYTALGAIKTVRLANNRLQQRTYDAAGRLTSYTLANEIVQIHYNLANQIDAITPVDPLRRQQFTYDAAGRLATYRSPTLNENYTYDANGNRRSRIANNVTTAYGYLANSNRLQTINATPITHDAIGNRLKDVTRQYTYDGTGRLTQLLVGARLARYEYNGLGERVFKQVGTDSRHFVYDDSGHLLGEYGPTGQPLMEYAWLGDNPVAYRVYRLVNAVVQVDLYAIETDHLATPRVITDATQRLRWRWYSAPFGDSIPNANPAAVGPLVFNLRFPGQYYDAESGLHYNYRRDYDPQTGRYVQSDPIGLRAGINTYAYVEGNPLNRSDPMGLRSCTCSVTCISFPFIIIVLCTRTELCIDNCGNETRNDWHDWYQWLHPFNFGKLYYCDKFPGRLPSTPGLLAPLPGTGAPSGPAPNDPDSA